MKIGSFTAGQKKYTVVSCNTAVVGSGAAGLCCALRLAEFGVDTALVTEGLNLGISRNTGSDKQTYYKISLCGNTLDSPKKMAEDLFSGGCADGDTALCEAAMSARAFLNLCELGVPFPTNKFGEYVGYITDHDMRGRATSAGPLTSKIMTERLELAVKKAGIPVFDQKRAVSIIKSHDNRVAGILALNLNPGDDGRFTLFNCRNVVFATGGPVSLYRDTVYPENSRSAFGVLAAAGVTLKNLTEWQFGLASICPRWNVSGSYMQALPRIFSKDACGREYDLLEMLPIDKYQALSLLFQKGYQWPFDCKKAQNGSSAIDLLVYKEVNFKNRKVFLDYTKNSFSLKKIDFNKLNPEAYNYLKDTGALQNTPIERLINLNRPAYQLFLDKGVDLKKEPLQIALSAQHHNGGIDVDINWQTDLHGLFVIGEAAGTHGIERPGGSALNAGQVGALRSAEYIKNNPANPLSEKQFINLALPILTQNENLCDEALKNSDNSLTMDKTASLMSQSAGVLRNKKMLEEAYRQVQYFLREFPRSACIKPGGLEMLYHLQDQLTGALCVLSAMKEFCRHKISRGSAIYYDQNGQLPMGINDEQFRFSIGETKGDTVQLLKYNNGRCEISYRPVRPLPKGGGVFETVWKEYRQKYSL